MNSVEGKTNTREVQCRKLGVDWHNTTP